MKNKLSSLLLLSTICLAAAAQAGDNYTARSGKDAKDSKAVLEKAVTEPRFYLSLSAGGEFDIHATKFISNGSGDVGFPASAGVPAVTLPTRVQSRDFTTMHDPGVVNGVLEAGYKINDIITVFGGFTYSHANGQSHGVGTVTDPFGAFGAAGGVYELKAGVSDYEAYTGRAGLKVTMPRYVLDLIHAPQGIKPYFSASAGGKYLKAQDANFTAGYFVAQNVELYKDSWVFTSQATFGYEYDFMPNVGVILESGYGYDSKPDRGNGLRFVNGVNDGGNRLYSVVNLGAKIRF